MDVNLFFCLIVARTHYVDDFQFLPLHQNNFKLNCFVDIFNFFLDAFCFIDAQYNYLGTYSNVLLAFNWPINMFDYEEVSLSCIVMNLVLLVT